MRWVMYITWLPHPVCRQYPALYHPSFASASSVRHVGQHWQIISGGTRVPVACRNTSTTWEILGTSNSFMGNPSSTYGGFGYALQSTRIGFYPELSDVVLLSLVQPISNVHGCRCRRVRGRIHCRRPMPDRQESGRLVDGYIPRFRQ